jgi:hypothetical protein
VDGGRGSRALVLGRNGRRAVVLTPDGAFRSVRAEEGWQPGQEVELRQRGVPRWAWTAPMAAAAALVAWVLSWAPASPAAYVYVDGAQSVTLALTATGRVLAVEGHGGSLPPGVRPGETAAQAVDLLTRSDAGLVQPGAPSGVVVALYAPKGANPPPPSLLASVAAAARRNRAVFEAVYSPHKTHGSPHRGAAASPAPPSLT